MLTGMKLSGDIDGITAYHTRQENYYFKQGRDLVDDLLDKGIAAQSGQPLGYVLVRGKLAGRLGFSQEGESISEIDFKNLLEGKDREGNTVSRKHKCHGIDLTFSAPKSVSIAGLVMNDLDVIKAHKRAVLETMKEIETFAYGRLTSRSKEHTGKMVWVEVLDGFSREKEPHLHTHCVVMNITEAGNKVLALDGREIMKRDFYRFFDALYKRRLEKELKDYLGYNLTYIKKGEWRLDKISKRCEESFSKRRQEILEAESKGMCDMAAWRKTRKAKDPRTNKDIIRKMWQQIFYHYNIGDEKSNRREAEKERKEWAKKASCNILEAG